VDSHEHERKNSHHADAPQGLMHETDISTVKRLLKEQAPRQWRHYLTAFICMALVAATTAFSAWLIKDIVNKIFIERDMSALWWIVALIIATYSIKGSAAYYQAVMLMLISNSIIADAQRRIFAHLLKMNLQYFNENHSTNFISQQAFITRSAASALNLIVTAIGRDFLTLLGLFAVMLIQDPLMSLASLFILPFAIISVRALSTRIKKLVRREFHGFTTMLENIAETSRGIRMVKAFNLEPRFLEKQHNAILSFERASNKMAMVGARASPVMETLGGFLVAMVVLYGGWRVIVGGATPGEFFSFITALLLAYEPAKRLARANVDLSAALVGVKMLHTFLLQPAGEAETEAAQELSVTEGKIVFQDISFGYSQNAEVLSRLSFEAHAGMVTAIVGESGAGKSTICALLLRYWNPMRGKILIDGVDITSVSRTSLRDCIAYVGQDVFLFNGTIRENISIGKVDASQLEIEAAARAAYAHDFITNFREGYETVCGENGVNLSGGQRQRIAIARAFLKDAPILLLDEATSALDAKSETIIKDAIRNLTTGRTTLIISHRSQTIEMADKVYVIEDGQATVSPDFPEKAERQGGVN
jgi:ATP-binding cassette, subfamily B, bacterial MsbA